MKKNQKTRRLVLTAFFVAAQLVLMLTPVGYIPIGPVRATTMHIPVILGGMAILYEKNLAGEKKKADSGR